MRIYHPSDVLRWSQVRETLRYAGVTIHQETRLGPFKLIKDGRCAWTTPSGDRLITIEADDPADALPFLLVIEKQFMIYFRCETVNPE